MATNFPNNLDTFTNPTANDKVDVLSHADQHANANDAIEALQTKVGVNGSAFTSTHDYKLSSVSDGDKAISNTGNQTITGDVTVTGALTSEGLVAGAGDIETTGNVVATNVGLNDAKVSADGSIDTHSDVNTAGKIIGDNLEWNGTSWVPFTPTSGLSVETAVFIDEKPAGTAGGTSSTTYTTRDLNTTVGNTSVDSNITLSANQITLKAGDYLIDCTVPSYARRAKSIIYNVTDASTELVGNSVYGTATDVSYIQKISGIISVASTKIFDIRMRSNTAQGNGLGNPLNLGEPEVYTQISITKIG